MRRISVFLSPELFQKLFVNSGKSEENTQPSKLLSSLFLNQTTSICVVSGHARYIKQLQTSGPERLARNDEIREGALSD